MKKNVMSNVFVLICLVVYHFLFWKEQPGLNTLLFSGLLIIGLVISKVNEGFSKQARISILITLITAGLVVWQNSDISKIVHLLSLITMTGFVHRRDLEHTIYAFVAGLLGSITTPVNIIRHLGPLDEIYNQLRPAWRYVRFGIIPAGIVGIFYTIYAFANPKFAELSADFVSYSSEMLFTPFQKFSPAWLGFLALGLFVSGGVLWSPMETWLKNRQAQKTDQLIRKRSVRPANSTPLSILSLKNEYRVAIMVICSLNILLFFVNVIDVRYLWFDFSEQTPAQLSQFVHEGTYLLIISMALAMLVLLGFFRKNLNFYPNNRLLRVAAYLWVIQNAMLALSVGMRNFKYIDAYGLAYKRIGVVIFLLLTLFGLLTMFFKIRDIKSEYYLLKTNAWALYIILTLTCFINWDVAITRYNLTAGTKTIDMNFLLEEISDKNLYVLYEEAENIYRYYPNYDFKIIDNKRKYFDYKQAQYSWASWNYADYRNRQFLKNRQTGEGLSAK